MRWFVPMLVVQLSCFPGLASDSSDNDRLVRKIWHEFCMSGGELVDNLPTEQCGCFVEMLMAHTSEDMRAEYVSTTRYLVNGATSELVFSAPFEDKLFWAALENECGAFAHALEAYDPTISERSYILLPGIDWATRNPISGLVDWHFIPQ